MARRWSTLPEDTRVADGILTRAAAQLDARAAADHDRSSAARWRPPPAVPRLPRGRVARCRGPTKSGALYVDGGLKPDYRYQVTSAEHEPADGRVACGHRRPRAESRLLRPAQASRPRSRTWRCRSPPGRPRRTTRRLRCRTTSAPTSNTRLTVQRGHSNDAMLNFFSIKKGYCEQFSGTFAAMARAVGLPTRVMVGFTQGSASLRRPVPRRRPSRPRMGRGLVRRLRLGAVRPDTGRGAPGAEQHTGDRAAQDEGNGTAGGTIDESPPTPTFEPPVSQRPSAENGPATGSTTPREPALNNESDGSSPADGSSPRSFWSSSRGFVGMPRVLNRWSRHRARDPADRVTSAWAATVRSLTMAGAPRVNGSTPLEYATVGRRRQGRDRRDRPAGDPRCLLTAGCRRQRSRPQRTATQRGRRGVPGAHELRSRRLLDHLDPRSAWGRITG